MICDIRFEFELLKKIFSTKIKPSISVHIYSFEVCGYVTAYIVTCVVNVLLSMCYLDCRIFHSVDFTFHFMPHKLCKYLPYLFIPLDYAISNTDDITLLVKCNQSTLAANTIDLNVHLSTHREMQSKNWIKNHFQENTFKKCCLQERCYSVSVLSLIVPLVQLWNTTSSANKQWRCPVILWLIDAIYNLYRRNGDKMGVCFNFENCHFLICQLTIHSSQWGWDMFLWY